VAIDPANGRFVMELSKVQSRPDNMPITGGVDETIPEPEAKKDR